MKPNISLWQLVGFTITIFAGTLLHFVYEWTKDNILVAPFSAVNESTWEHMKLLFMPLFVFAIIQSRYFVEYNNFWCIKLIGILVGITLIPVLFYTYSGILGKTYDWLNITLFVVAAAASFYTEFRLFRNQSLTCQHPWIAFAALCIIGIMFIVLTFVPPHIPLFQDPIKGSYGAKIKS